jgi:hypothetical protein
MFSLPPFFLAIYLRPFASADTLNSRKFLMLLYLGLGIIVLWILGYVAFHVTMGLIHIMPILGLALIITYFIRRKRPVG